MGGECSSGMSMNARTQCFQRSTLHCNETVNVILLQVSLVLMLRLISVNKKVTLKLHLLIFYNHITFHELPQVLWEHVQPSQNFSIYNGGVEAVSNLFGRHCHITLAAISNTTIIPYSS